MRALCRRYARALIRCAAGNLSGRYPPFGRTVTVPALSRDNPGRIAAKWTYRTRSSR